MKKFIFLAAFFTITISAQAEVICMKNRKKLKVTNSSVKVKAPQILTTAESTCPTGYTQLIEVKDPSTTMTGSWSLSGSETDPYVTETISFPEPLTSAPTSVILVEAGTLNSTCTGSSSSPTAPAGVLCIYEGFQTGLINNFPDRYRTYRTIDVSGGSGSASIYGAALFGYPQSAADFYAWGTWAVGK